MFFLFISTFLVWKDINDVEKYENTKKIQKEFENIKLHLGSREGPLTICKDY